MGPVPEAPGLEDLDSIHPVEEMIEIEEDIIPLPLLPLPVLEINPTLVQKKPKKRSGKAKRLLIILVMFTTLGAAGWYAWSSGLIG